MAGNDLSFITIEVVDFAVLWNPQSVALITVRAERTGALAGLGTGDMAVDEVHTDNHLALYQGYALAVVRTTTHPGKSL